MAADLVAEMNPDGCVYYPGGEPIAPGTIVRLPGLAEVLARVGRARRDVARRTGRRCDRRAGRGRAAARSTADDFELATADWMACAGADAGGRRLWATPAPTHGPGLLSRDRRLRGGRRRVGRRRAPRRAGGDRAPASRARRPGRHVDGVGRRRERHGRGRRALQLVPALRERDRRARVRPDARQPGRPRVHARARPRQLPERGRRPATTLHAWVVSDTERRAEVGGRAHRAASTSCRGTRRPLARLLAGEERPGMLVAGTAVGVDPRRRRSARRSRVRSRRTSRRCVRRRRRVVERAALGMQVGAPGRARAAPGEAWEAAADPRTVGLALGV